MLIFRNATPDDYLFIAKGFHMAMLMENTPKEQIEKFASCVCKRDDVLYCAKNTIIAEVDGARAGMLTAYDGRFYKSMREKTFKVVKECLDIEFPGMEDEAQTGEYYLDSLAVWPEFRGKGLGRKLLEKGIEEGKNLNQTITLAVDPMNIRAQRLYESLGFKRKGDLFIFGHTYWKMVHSI